jgi:transposase-like protein
MPQKGRLPVEEKVRIVEDYLAGKIGFRSTCETKGIGQSTLKLWIRLYEMRGIAGLTPTAKGRKYSSELKETVVREYVAGGISLEGLCRKYDITHSQIVRKWIKKYNCREEFKAPNSGSEIYMAKGRETTLDERIEIVSYCIANGKDYGKVIERYGVSYQQVYTWVRKNEKYGADGLIDRRGKRKDEASMTEVEKLQAELKITQAKLKNAELENDVLKKLDEVERRRG